MPTIHAVTTHVHASSPLSPSALPAAHCSHQVAIIALATTDCSQGNDTAAKVKMGDDSKSLHETLWSWKHATLGFCLTAKAGVGAEADSETACCAGQL